MPKGRGRRVTVAKETARPESPLEDHETDVYVAHANMNIRNIIGLHNNAHEWVN